jgi:hypothetical protein
MTYLDPQRAAAVFAERLATQTDVSDVHAALNVTAASGLDGAAGERAGGAFVLLDVRGDDAWQQGHIPGAASAARPDPAGRHLAAGRADRHVLLGARL